MFGWEKIGHFRRPEGCAIYALKNGLQITRSKYHVMSTDDISVVDKTTSTPSSSFCYITSIFVAFEEDSEEAFISESIDMLSLPQNFLVTRV